jgi:hypothetical protein
MKFKFRFICFLSFGFIFVFTVFNASIALSSRIKTAAKKNGVDMIIEKLYLDDPDTCGGIDVYGHFYNNYKKTIKYIDIEIIPYNAVKDIQHCTISNKSLAKLQFTGPIKPHTGKGCKWRAVWHNSTIRNFSIKKITVTYMDNIILSIDGEWIQKFFKSYYR